MLIDPEIIYFTHSKIRARFSGCGKTITETFEEIKNGKTKISDIPKIKVIYDKLSNKYYSKNNRRLYLFKLCKQNNLLEDNKIDVVIEISKIPITNNYTLNAKTILK